MQTKSRYLPFILPLCTLLICYLLLEAFSFVLYSTMHGQAFSFSAVDARRTKIVSDWEESLQRARDVNKNGLFLDENVVHPYLGFVYSRDKKSTFDKLLTNTGLIAEQDPFVAGRNPNNAIVAIAGGSVAEFLFVQSRNVLRDALQALPQFKSRKIVIIMLGRRGWKEPQQVLSVAYYLSQGGRIDLLINIDGRNEATDPYRNFVGGVYPAFPEAGPYELSIPQNPNNDAMGSALLWKKLRQLSATEFGHLKFSVTASSLWSFLDDYMLRQEVDEIRRMPNWDEKTLPYYKSGPDTMRQASKEDILAFSERLWEEGTRQLQYLANGNRFYYFHFLQPNQYLAGSKTLTTEELAHDFFADKDNIDRMPVEVLYPQFVARVKPLHDEGINIYDLTGIFKNTKESIYADACCHVNQQGNDMLAKAIGENITQYFKAAPPATRSVKP